jgi:hypothetical protein
MSETPIVINSLISPIQIKNLTIQNSPISISTLQFTGTSLKIEGLGLRLPGVPGESAYDAAVKGGYSGTEENFYSDIAKDIEPLTNQDIEDLIKLFV